MRKEFKFKNPITTKYIYLEVSSEYRVREIYHYILIKSDIEYYEFSGKIKLTFPVVNIRNNPTFVSPLPRAFLNTTI